MTTCRTCTRPSDGHLCRACIATLKHDLAVIAELWPESLVTLARLDVMPTGGRGGKSKGGAKSSPLPYAERAAEVRWVVESTIVTWLRDVAGDRVPDGVGSVQAACRWLGAHATMVGGLPQGPQCADEVADARKSLERLVDRPAERIVVAHCDLCQKPLSDDPAALSAVCDACEHVVVVESQRQAKLMAALGKDVTKDAAVAAVAYFCRRRISTKTINRWIDQGRIRQRDDGRVSVADIVRLAQREIVQAS